MCSSDMIVLQNVKMCEDRVMLPLSHSTVFVFTLTLQPLLSLWHCDPTVLKNDPTYKSDKLNPAIEETDETPEGEKGDLIDWSQTVRPPLQSSVSVNEKCSKPAPLIDWEDVFTSRQSFCEFDSPGKKPALPSTNSTADINANFSITSDVRAWLNGSKHLEDKGIMTSPLQIKDCPCSRTNFQFSSNAKPQRTLGGSLPKRSVYALPLHSVDDFSDDDSLSSLESLEMDDSVFRESLYSLSSEHLYQSQTFTQVTDEIYEDSLCEDAPSHRQPLFDPEPIEDAITQLDFKGSMLSSCFRNIHSQKNNIPVCSSDVLPEAESTSPGCEKDPALDLLSSPIKPSKDSLKIQPEGLYQLNFVSKETPVKYIKHKPLKPIHQVDAEYRCRKGISLNVPVRCMHFPRVHWLWFCGFLYCTVFTVGCMSIHWLGCFFIYQYGFWVYSPCSQQVEGLLVPPGGSREHHKGNLRSLIGS